MKCIKILMTIFCFYLFGCNKTTQTNNFAFDKDAVGKLTSKTLISAIDSLYPTDSIVKRNSNNAFLSSNGEIEIFDASGDKLLIIEPTSKSTETNTIKSIQIIDPRFTTKNGISIASTFKELKEAFPISKINNTLSTAVVFIDSLNAYVTIDKKFLPIAYRNNTDLKIEANSIADSAKIKHFWIQWNDIK
ncbi:hypothetical protein ACE939_09945 [Aquimarina sp. W85]|uniref:hypothetical protein n=1 Tax=Aquimarina rhodophyticola TaxID=3342246 RepID=UPI00366F3590